MGKKILVLAPHTDDGEYGCGGSIARFLQEGADVSYVAFSTCRASVPKGQPEDILKIEMLRSMDFFGIPEENRFILDYPVRHFQEYRQSILDDMLQIGEQVKPDMVLMPSIDDIHQDHHTIAEEAMRAYKKTTLLGYEVPWNNYSFDNQAYISLSDEQMQKKIGAIACYETQRMRDYSDPTFTLGLARTHGVQIGCKYAEVFEVIRWII